MIPNPKKFTIKGKKASKILEVTANILNENPYYTKPKEKAFPKYKKDDLVYFPYSSWHIFIYALITDITESFGVFTYSLRNIVKKDEESDFLLCRKNYYFRINLEELDNIKVVTGREKEEILSQHPYTSIFV